ncbi:BTB/POZ protein [Xylaria cubensis]|nr:BTB/POZ protein [Xylaria cubensis]
MAKFLENLLSSGDYADFKIVCKDQEFQVHKIIVCAQSPVIAAALKGYFEESKTNTYHVTDFDPTIVKCMIDYMYAGEYAQMPPDYRSDNKDQAQTTESRVWIYHGLVNCIADYFNVPELAEKATSTLDGLIKKHWSEDAFCNLFYETLGRTTDKGFRTMLATGAMDHLDELMARGLFNGADPSDELTPTILKLCATRFEKLTARINAQAKNLETIHSFFSHKKCNVCGNWDGESTPPGEIDL